MDQNQVYLIKSGDNSFVETENEIVIGISGGKFGVGTTLPESYLHVTGDTQIDGDLTVKGNFTTVNSTTIQVDDKNIELGVGSTTDLEANGGGITLHGLTNKSINWIDSTQAWTSSENFYTANGKKIATDKITALDSDGLSLFDDSDNGLTIKAGKIGIHQNSPEYDLDVNGSGNFNSLYVGGSEVITSASNDLGKWSSGSGTSDKVYNFDISGDGLDYNFSGDQTGKDPNLIAFTGETLIFNNVGGGHTLAIKDSNGNDVAVESSGVTTFSPSSAGIYTYYCTSHPSNMTGTITIYAYEEIYYNSGKVGINTDNPEYDFDVFGSGNFSQGLFVSGNSVLTGVVNGSDQWQEGSEAGEIYYDQGNVGINKSNPNSALDVDGVGNFSQGLFVSGNSVLTGISSNNLGKWQEGSEAGEIYYNQGNVGINKSNPSSTLDVDGAVNISSSLNIGSTFSFDQNGSIGGSQPVSINDIIKWDGNKWIAGTNPGSQQSTINVPEAMINSLVSGESIQTINFADIYSSPPKIATDLEIDGDGSIIPYSISGVTTSGYSLIFAQTIPNNNYKIHTVFGGKDVLWDTGNAGDIFYNDGDVIIGQNVVISGSLEASNFVGGGGGSSTGEVPPSFETNIPSGSLTHPIAFGPFSQTPKVATTLEIDGDGEIIPYTVSGVSATGYHAIFSTAIPTSDYILHTVFGGHTSHWTQDITDNISYDLGDVGIQNNLNVLGDVVISGTLEASNFVGGGGSSTGEAPASFETNIPSGSLTHPIAFGPFSQTPKVAATLEIDGDGDIIPYVISGVSATGYHAVFLDNIPNSNYTIHTVFGGGTSSSSSSYWDQDGANNLSYNSGNVGIGTTSPTAHLTVNGSPYPYMSFDNSQDDSVANTSLGAMFFKGRQPDGTLDTGASIRARGTGAASNSNNDVPAQLVFATNPGGTGGLVERMVINEVGNVGIGTTNPTAPLHVVNNSSHFIKFGYGENYAEHQIRWDSATAQLHANFDQVSTSSARRIVLGVDGNEKMSILHDGNVGIGTTNPSQGKLVTIGYGGHSNTRSFVAIAHNNNVESYFRIARMGSGDSTSVSLANNYNRDVPAYQADDNTAGVSDITFRDDGSLSFSTGAVGATEPVEKMRIDANGNVGIGTDSPSSNLHVQVGDSQTATLNLNNSDGNGTISQINLGYTADPDHGNIKYTGNITFSNAGDTERMRIDSNGNVGIGTTNPSTTLDVVGNGTGTVPTLSLKSLSSNAFNHSINAFNSNLTTGQNQLIMVGKEGSAKNSGYIGYKWYDDASDSNILTFGHWAADNLLNLTAVGNVGIGITNPPSKLTLNPGNVANAGTWSDSALAIVNPTNIGSYSQISFGYTAGTTNAAAYLGFVSTNQASNGYGDLVFGTRSVSTDTAPTERMRITSGGNVGIGNVNPDCKLTVTTDNAPSGYSMKVGAGGGGSDDRAVYIAAGKAVPSAAGDCIYIAFHDGDGSGSGGIRCSSSPLAPEFFSGSDVRMKKNIEDCDINGIEKIKSLRLRKWDWNTEKDMTPADLGLIADEVEEVYPELISRQKMDGWEHCVSEGEEDLKTIPSESKITLTLVKAVQEQQTIIEDLKKEIEQLKSQ